MSRIAWIALINITDQIGNHSFIHRGKSYKNELDQKSLCQVLSGVPLVQESLEKAPALWVKSENKKLKQIQKSKKNGFKRVF